MHNKVAHTLARAFVRSGYETLRFNFRGTEMSEGHFDDGIGELDDALAAIEWMRATTWILSAMACRIFIWCSDRSESGGCHAC